MPHPATVRGPADDAAALRLVSEGEVSVEGRLVDASNATLYCGVYLDGVGGGCVYKPIAGERPLWDFPDGTLAAREVATHLVSSATGWHLVPPTVLRDGPFGPGMCQLWIDVDEEQALVDVVPATRLRPGWRCVLEAVDGHGERVALVHADDERLRQLALLDVVVNNADRKGGHVLTDRAGRVYGVDHGVSFHVEPKLRTVLWGWAGEPIAAGERAVLRRVRAELDGGLGVELAGLLTTAEVAATRARLDRLLARGRFPQPGHGWPAIPWPAF